MSPKESVIERIQKLLALAAEGSGATPAEAESAAEAASRLMFLHAIAEAEVRKHQRATGDTSHFAREYVLFTKSAAWERDLMSWIAWTNDTYFTPGNKWSKRGLWSAEIVGHKDNVGVSVLMFGWLRDELHRQAKREYARERPANDSGHSQTHMDPFRFHVSFKRGAVSALATRLMDAKRAREQKAREEGQSTALALIGEVKDDALVFFYPHMRSWVEQKRAPKVEIEEEQSKGKTRKLRTRKPKTIHVSQTAYTAGRIAGQTVRLSGSKELDQ